MKAPPKITLLNVDCLEYFREVKDKQFPLLLTDPPYGIQKGSLTGFKKDTIQHQQDQKCREWDRCPPLEAWEQMFRISKNQIIFGMQYFANYLPAFSQLIIWDKQTGDNFFADGEAAFCSIPGTLRIFRHQWCGAFKDSERGQKAIHVNQKPVALYKWLLSRYAKPGDTILDPYGGSMSLAIACHDLGYDAVICEKDPEYFKAGERRLKEHQAQLQFF